MTGLFLILFLVVHLIGNLQLLWDDGGEAFNSYAYMMTHNPLIKAVSIGNYIFIVLHAIQGITLALANRGAKSKKYAVSTGDTASWASKNMAWLGVLILAFLCIHMGDFWWKMKFNEEALGMVNSGALGHEVIDLYTRVSVAFKVWWIVAIYIIGLIALALHLNHGFQSAFQTLGLSHKKYTPLIKAMGTSYAILIPLGFAIIPLYIFFVK